MDLQCIAREIIRLVKGITATASPSPWKTHIQITPSFASPGGGNPRQKPMAATFLNTPKTNDRLAQLWEELRADPVPIRTVTKQDRTVGKPVLQSQDEPLPFMSIDDPGPANRNMKVDLATWFHSLLEPQVAESPAASAVEAMSEGAASPEASIASAHEASLALSNPFHWEPKPSWTAAPARSNQQFSNMAHPQRFAPRPKIPKRPLHKQPFYRRFFFYLRHWISGSK